MVAKPRLAIGRWLVDIRLESGGPRLRIGANRLAVASAQAQSQNESEKVNGKDQLYSAGLFYASQFIPNQTYRANADSAVGDVERGKVTTIKDRSEK